MPPRGSHFDLGIVDIAMHMLVIHAHPNPDSLSSQLYRTAVDSLRSSGHEVDTIDLYADGYDPRMTRAERLAYETDCPILDPQVRLHADLLGRVDGLLFIYPTWFWGLPAVLKGWLERTLVPGVGFVLDPRSNKVRGGLRNIRWVIGISTYGSSRVATLRTADCGRRVIMRCVRILAPLRCRTKWLALYRADAADPARVAAFLTRIERTMASL